MTTADLVLDAWALKPAGKAVRVGIAAAGLATATLVLLMATTLASGTWMVVLVGVSLAATSIRAARYPTLVRLSALTANLLAIPLFGQMI